MAEDSAFDLAGRTFPEQGETLPPAARGPRRNGLLDRLGEGRRKRLSRPFQSPPRRLMMPVNGKSG